MKRCEKCNVNVESVMTNCPLCGAYLVKDGDAPSVSTHAYPQKSDRHFFKKLAASMLIFVSVLGTVVPAVIDLIIHKRITWAIHPIFGVAVFWLAIGRALFRHVEMRRFVMWDGFFAACILFYLYRFSHGADHWAFHIGVPIVIFAVTGIEALLMLVDKRNRNDYAMSLTQIAIIDVLVFVLSLAIFKEMRWGVYVCLSLGIITVTALSLFGGRKYFGEIKRRLHF